MSREIKFRAWTNNCWINKGMVYDYQDTTYIESFGFNDVELPLMQFTGLKDKNGKEVYEGDILSDKWKVEVYQNGEGTFMVKFNTNQKVNKPMSFKKYLKAREKAGTSNCEGYRDCIVIGNIYENPELLKQ